MRIFYRSSYLLVTDRLIKVGGRNPSRVALDRIEHAYVVDTAAYLPSRLPRCRWWPAIGAVAVPAAVTALGLTVGPQGWILAVAAALSTGALSALFTQARLRPVKELWIVTNGRHVCLFRDADQQIFGQVCRALTRALEYSR